MTAMGVMILTILSGERGGVLLGVEVPLYLKSRCIPSLSKPAAGASCVALPSLLSNVSEYPDI